MLSEVFTKDLIKVDLEAMDKDEAFEEMVSLFCAAKECSGKREPVLDSLRERESVMSTGIYTGVAIPHCKTDKLSSIYGVLGVSSEGIDYEALDGNPVHLIFMLLMPGETDRHLKILSALAQLVQEPGFYTDILRQKTADGVFNTLKSYEDHMLDKV